MTWGKSKRGIGAKDKDNSVMTIDHSVLRAIAETVGVNPVESGGMLGGIPPKTATAFYFDKTGSTSAATYSPDTKTINKILNEDWNPKNIRLLGFVHSHPGAMTSPSQGDIIYAGRILEAIPDMPELWLPIITCDSAASSITMTAWKALHRHGRTQLFKGRICIQGGNALPSRLDSIASISNDQLQCGVPLEAIHLYDIHVHKPKWPLPQRCQPWSPRAPEAGSPVEITTPVTPTTPVLPEQLATAKTLAATAQPAAAKALVATAPPIATTLAASEATPLTGFRSQTATTTEQSTIFRGIA